MKIMDMHRKREQKQSIKEFIEFWGASFKALYEHPDLYFNKDKFTVGVKLSKPVCNDEGQEVNTLQIRKPTGGELKTMGREKHAIDQMYRLISLICSLPDTVIEDSMDFDDLDLVAEVMNAFLLRSRRIGTNSMRSLV